MSLPLRSNAVYRSTRRYPISPWWDCPTIVAAFVKQRAAVDAEELDRFCQHSGLANFKRPRRYVFVESIPRSPVGKLLRRKLVAGEYEPAQPSGPQQQGTAA